MVESSDSPRNPSLSTYEMLVFQNPTSASLKEKVSNVSLSFNVKNENCLLYQTNLNLCPDLAYD